MSASRFQGGILMMVVCISLSGCERDDAQPAVASVNPRAEWILEGGAPRIGEVAELDAVVTAPPGTHLDLVQITPEAPVERPE